MMIMRRGGSGKRREKQMNLTTNQPKVEIKL
jgi:hypothetical protein